MTSAHRGLGTALVLGLVLALGPWAPAQSLPRIVTIHPDDSYQTFVGWEVAADLGASGDPSAELLRAQLIDRVSWEVGVSRLRIEVRAGIENPVDHWTRWQAGEISAAQWRRLAHASVNDDDDPGSTLGAGFQFAELDRSLNALALPLGRRVTERGGERLQLNFCYVARPDDVAPDAPWVHADPDEYAEFVLAVYEHLRQEFGLVPDTWEVLRQPLRSGRWDGGDMGRAMVAASERLRAAGFVPRFVAPSTVDAREAVAVIDAMLAVPGAADDLAELTYSRYGRVLPDHLDDLADRARRHGLGLSMLEGSSSIDDLFVDLTRGQVVAWNGAPSLLGDSTRRDLYSIDRRVPDRPRLSLNPNARYLQQAMRYVRPGMTRVRVSTRSSTLEAVAFTGEDGAVVIVIKGHTEGPIAIEGLPAGTYGTSWTTLERADVPGFDVDLRRGARLETVLPLPGVLSVFSR